MSDKKQVAETTPSVSYLDALRVVQQHLDEQAAITGKHERLNLVGHPPSCKARAGAEHGSAGFEVIGGDNLPEGLKDALVAVLGRRNRGGH